MADSNAKKRLLTTEEEQVLEDYILYREVSDSGLTCNDIAQKASVLLSRSGKSDAVGVDASCKVVLL